MSKHSGAIFTVLMSLMIYGILKPIMPAPALWPCFTLMFAFFVAPVMFFDFLAQLIMYRHTMLKSEQK